ncbi:MAG TPA: hypothetical protein VFV51_18425 [Vicinamibacterales bacterium]|nr:hypothetical protein [Vicinamibacterales bacterium]
MHLRGGGARGDDVEHVVQRWQQQRRQYGIRRAVDRRHRHAPDLDLLPTGLLQQLVDPRRIGNGAVGGNSRVDVLAKFVSQRFLGGSRKERDPQIRGADVIGFVHDEIAAVVEAARGAGERERDHQPHQAEHRGLHRPKARELAVRQFAMPDAQTPAHFHGQQHAPEQQQPHQRCEGPVETAVDHR